MPSGPVATHVMDAVAKCLCAAMSYEETSAFTGVSVGTIRTWAQGANDTFQNIYRGYQEKTIGAVIDHRLELQKHLDASYKAIADALDSKAALQLRVDTAKWVLGRFMDPIVSTGRAQGAKVDVNVGVQANLATEQFTVAFGDIASSVKDVLEAVKQQSAAKDPHEKVGDEALPSTHQITEEIEDADLLRVPTNGSAKVPDGTPVEQ